MPRKQKGATPLADGNSLPTGKASKSNKAQTAGRISSRVRPSNANLGVVDEETRLAVKRARLEALEADNFVDNGVEPPGLEDDDFYVGDNETARKASTIRQKAKSSAGAPVKKWGGRDVATGPGGRAVKLRKLQDIVSYEISTAASSSGGAAASSAASSSSSAAVIPPSAVAAANAMSQNSNIGLLPPFRGSVSESLHYIAAGMGPPQHPPRPFCSICGFEGKYSCTRCGSKFCSSKCRGTHMETRCMKGGGGGPGR